MAYPTPAQIDAAVPVDGKPSRALTNTALKNIVGAASYLPTDGSVPTRSVANADFSGGRLKATPATDPDDCVTKVQLDQLKWGAIPDQPIVVASGATQAEARASIGAGTSNLEIGTTDDTAAAGNHRHGNATTTTDGFMSKEDKVALADVLTDPTEAKRGAPFVASAAEVRAGTNASKLVTPRSAFVAIAAAGVGVLNSPSKAAPCIVKTGASTASIAAGTSVQVGETRVVFSASTPITMPALTAGEDYAVLVSAAGAVSAVADPITAPTTVPAGFVKIGGFHYGLTAPGSTVASGSFATAKPSMVWTDANVARIAGINEFSIWDLTYRPTCDPRGMARVTNPEGLAAFWFDIYFCSTNHIDNGTSRYNTNVASGTVLPRVPLMFGGDGAENYEKLSWYEANEIVFSHGKRLMSYQEFAAAAFGVTENQGIGGEVTIPATKREPGYTSKWGGEQMTGHHWVMGLIAHADAGTEWLQGVGRGQAFGTPVRGIFGGDRYYASFSGSRCSKWGDPAWGSFWSIGLRAACDHFRL